MSNLYTSKELLKGSQNQFSSHAVLSGILIPFYYTKNKNRYNLLFQTQYEKVFIWSHNVKKSSNLVCEINFEEVNKLPFWKTLGYVMYLAQLYYDYFGIPDKTEINYHLLESFNPKSSIENLMLSTDDIFDMISISRGCTYSLMDIERILPLIELLLEDETCFTALGQLLSSLQLHNCCLICELKLLPLKMHVVEEPSIFEHGYFIPKMEAAIVQACRCVESIVGEPPGKNKRNGILKHKDKWIELTKIDLDVNFEKANISYMDFYYKVFFELRNPAAHSYGNINLRLKRQAVSEAQCFAFQVLNGYINNHVKSIEKASEILNFNRGLVDEFR